MTTISSTRFPTEKSCAPICEKQPLHYVCMLAGYIDIDVVPLAGIVFLFLLFMFSLHGDALLALTSSAPISSDRSRTLHLLALMDCVVFRRILREKKKGSVHAKKERLRPPRGIPHLACYAARGLWRYLYW